MKIVFAVSALNLGGAQRVASTLCNEWACQGHEVILVATYSGNAECFYEINQKIKIIYLSKLLLNKKKNIFSKFRRLVKLRSILKEEKPDIVISFLTNVNVAIIMSGLFLNIPTIVCERSNPFKHRLPIMLKLQVSVFYPFATIITVQTELLAKQMRKKVYGKKIEIIPNSLPRDIPFGKARNNAPKNIKTHKIIAVGRLEPEKQFDLLIKTCASIFVEYPNWQLHIIGEGSERINLQQLIEEHRISENVFIEGMVKQPWQAMVDCDIFVLTSLYEGFPNALLEAMAIGLACVSFDCPNGPREMSRNGKDIILVPMNNLVELRAGIVNLILDDKLRINLGLQASNSVVERYALNNVLKIWEKLFTKALKDNSL